MISPEVLRRYPFFAGLSHQHILVLANAAEELNVEDGHYFFREGQHLDRFFLNLAGAAAIVMELPDSEVEQSVADQLMGDVKTREVITSTIGPGEVFGWSGLVPPHSSTASCKALTPCRVVAFNCTELLNVFETDCEFGYQMMLKAAQLIRERLRDLRIEGLYSKVE